MASFLFWSDFLVNEIMSRVFYQWFVGKRNYIGDFLNISAQLEIYQRFFKYIDRNSKYISDFPDISICRQKSSNIAIYMIRGSVFHTSYKKQFNILPVLRIKKRTSLVRFSPYYFFFTGSQSSI
ncbi:hypothetical protein BTGOE5_03560 [Bacillus thuringiensis]|nr:hypothetical protein BTGOE5_03560 [Bacillus thuringiensis]OFD09664.1 hypothetical protein BTGOE7_03900 [Bacillus thuringiensis]